MTDPNKLRSLVVMLLTTEELTIDLLTDVLRAGGNQSLQRDLILLTEVLNASIKSLITRLPDDDDID